ncbi:MAG TPA: SPOR domain-containing protein [Terracidiphilus sp.]|jgi:cell division septation protein DedD|nr:SPOR domain-containing protein [Terracidiphilus sp.]
MRGVFDDEELVPAPARRDTELTLGSGMLLAIFFGLVLLCGLCFGLGYAVAHRGSQPLAMGDGQTSPGVLPAQSGSSLAKPSATQQTPAAAPAADALAASGTPDGSNAQPAATSSGIAPTAAAETLPAAVQASNGAGQPLVRPALTSAVAVSQGGQTIAAGARSAFAPVSATLPASGLMVQIAAVSNSEDAAVLTGALRKRGYAVTVRRDPADNLVHVRIGPFATVAEANTWKTKLLNDGYNAIVQP